MSAVRAMRRPHKYLDINSFMALKPHTHYVRNVLYDLFNIAVRYEDAFELRVVAVYRPSTSCVISSTIIPCLSVMSFASSSGGIAPPIRPDDFAASRTKAKPGPQARIAYGRPNSLMSG